MQPADGRHLACTDTDMSACHVPSLRTYSQRPESSAKSFSELCQKACPQSKEERDCLWQLQSKYPQSEAADQLHARKWRGTLQV
ncbi:hypothetical protein ABBQ38_006509 [Trebouxia sp. C0009 RCD-2024]